MPEALTAVIVSALSVEYAAVRAHLEEVHEVWNQRGIAYEAGRFELSGDRAWTVWLVQLLEPGNESAALAAQEAIQHFQPRIVMFVGVAGGLKDVALGDVVVGTKVYGYGSGAAGPRFLPRPDVGESNEKLLQNALAISRQQEWLQRIKELPAQLAPRVFIGPIAAGPAVIKSTRSTVYRFLRDAYGDALAVEMEGRGFLKAARTADGVRALVVRGISDLINKKSTADRAGWQGVAASHAAAVAFEVLAREGFAGPAHAIRADARAARPSLDRLMSDLMGRDPVAGNRAVEELGAMKSEALPYLKQALMNCGVNGYLPLQTSIRLPKAFRAVGDDSTEVLVNLIRSGPWATKLEASHCFYRASKFPVSAELAQIIKSWDEPDPARCAIEALGWLGCSEWSHVIQKAVEEDKYAFEKLTPSAFDAFSLMLALEDSRPSIPFSLSRVESLLSQWRTHGGASEEVVRNRWRLTVPYFHPLATNEMRIWIQGNDKLLQHLALDVLRFRRPPTVVRFLAGIASSKPPQELLWRLLEVIGEIGTREACDAVVKLLDIVQSEERGVTDLWKASAITLAKMYHHLTDPQYEKYGNKILLPQPALMNAWYTGMKKNPRVKDMEQFLDSSEEVIRRPAAVCLGAMYGEGARQKLRQYLRHALTKMDAVFILAGLIRSGATEYCHQFYEALGDAVNHTELFEMEYIWKREVVSVLSLDPEGGIQKAKAWAELFGVDFEECIDEMGQLLPF
jgi:nucleoside phosphorylase